MSWGNCLPGKLKKIKTLQKKCVRNIAGKDFRSHTDPLFKKLEILKLDDLIQYNLLAFMHKLFLGKQPESFIDFLKKPDNFESSYRRKYCFEVDKLKNDNVGRFPTAVLPRAWNALDSVTKCIKSHKSFKKFIYGSFTETYSNNIKCREKSCPDCFPH